MRRSRGKVVWPSNIGPSNMSRKELVAVGAFIIHAIKTSGVNDESASGYSIEDSVQEASQIVAHVEENVQSGGI